MLLAVPGGDWAEAVPVVPVVPVVLLAAVDGAGLPGVALVPFEEVPADVVCDAVGRADADADAEADAEADADADADTVVLGGGVAAGWTDWLGWTHGELVAPAVLLLAVAEAALAGLPFTVGDPLAFGDALAPGDPPEVLDVLAGVLLGATLDVPGEVAGLLVLAGLLLVLAALLVPAGLLVVPLPPGAVGVLAGVALGVEGLVALSDGDDGDDADDADDGDAEVLGHVVVAGRLGAAALLGISPPAEPSGLPEAAGGAGAGPLAEENPAAWVSWPSASRSGGMARAMPMANTAQAMARPDRSRLSRRSLGCLRSRPGARGAC